MTLWLRSRRLRVWYSVQPSDYCSSFGKDTLRQILQWSSRGLYNFESTWKKKATAWPLRSYKKVNSKCMIKTALDNFFLSNKNFIKKKTYFMQNVSVWLIRRNLEVLAFLLWYRSNEFPVIRLRAIKQLNKMMKNIHLACKVTLGVQLDQWCTIRTCWQCLLIVFLFCKRRFSIRRQWLK